MNSRLRPTTLTGLLVFGALSWTVTPADDSSGLYEWLTGKRLAHMPGLRALDIAPGGWISMGVTYNGNNPANKSNAPVGFNDRSAEFQLNQLYLFLERAVNKEARHWDVGGRVDFLWGTDSRFTQPTGHWDDDLIDSHRLRFYDIALPQAYVEIATPFVRGATAKIGHFYTLLGHEVTQSPNNFFYSHSYAMQYAEPATHTGLLLSYPINDSMTLSGGAVTGPYQKADNVDRRLSNWNALGGLTWISEDGGTSVAAALTSGEDGKIGHNRTIVSLVLNRDLTDVLHYVIQYDHGVQQRATADGEAHWYGINQYLVYALSDTVSLGLRGEWFRDDSGFRVRATPASYYEVSTGVNWKPETWLLLRVEARNDWVDSKRHIFDSETRDHQFTLGANAAVTF